jgi:murein L,D-transpeptidase YafK
MAPKIVCFLGLLALVPARGFLSEQLGYARVRAAYDEKDAEIRSRLQELGITRENLRLCIRAFKQEELLEIWVAGDAGPFQLFDTIPIWLSSGHLGPKRQQGDGQVPEGLYTIDRFNPFSSFHLSLGINYPNLSDRIRSKGKNPGGDIFIHGSCVTIGCIPLTDYHIKTLYVLSVLARDAGQDNLEVHIFPFRLIEGFQNAYAGHPFLGFWQELQPMYLAFEQSKLAPMYYIDSQGRYLIK